MLKVRPRLSLRTSRPFLTPSHIRSQFHWSPTPKQPNFSVDKLKNEFEGTQERMRVWWQINSALLRSRASDLSTNATAAFQDVGGKLNQVTGYNEIEALKKQVVDIEHRITECREASKNAKTAFEQAVEARSSGQREVNDLLQRKSSWSDADVVRFTSLVRQDHLNEQKEVAAKASLAQAEAAVENEFNTLMRAILNRYHEEQVWSDKIRSASTYGSLLALGLNVAVFILAIVLVEPYKRRRLAETFEKRIEEISKDNRLMIQAGMSELSEHFSKQESVLSQIADFTLLPPPPITITPIDHETLPPSEEKPPPLLAPIYSWASVLRIDRPEQAISMGIGGIMGAVTVILAYTIAR